MRTSSRTSRLPGTTTVFAAEPHIPDYIASSQVTPRAAMSDWQATVQMADDMRLAAEAGLAITQEDLVRRGYSDEQIAALNRKAIAIADAMRGAS